MRTYLGLTTAALVAGGAMLLSGCQTLGDARSRIVQSPARCDTQLVQVYFEPDSAEVTDEGRAVLRQAAAVTRGCTVERVRVLGLADAAGAPEANLALSRQRAQAVTAAIAEAGLPAADFDIEAAGQAGAVAPDGAARPVRRRADIVIHLAPPR